MLSKPKKRKKKNNRANSAQHFKEWATSGREIKVNGKLIKAYTRGKLVEAFAYYGIPKTYQTIYLWEQNGILPKSPIVINGKTYYTRKMIEAIIGVVMDFGAGRVNWTDNFKNELHEVLNRVIQEELM